MSGRFVRASKFRHVYGKSTKKEQCFDNLRISKNAWDSNIVKANPKYVSVNWEASGGGAFAVIPLHENGKLPEQMPLFRGHTAAVLDTDWSPFDDSFIASASDDGKVMLWKVPEGFSVHQDPEAIADVAPVARLQGHTRKVGHVLFNPAAQGVLASSSGDYTVKLWDVEAGAPSLVLKHPDTIQSLSWKGDGSLLVTTNRDKRLRVWDARQQRPALETPGHSGAKNSRAVFLGDRDRIATTGFSKMSDRQLALWSLSGREPVDGFTMLDQISGICMPFWDEGTQCLYLAGKGDGNIRYYEYEGDKFEYLSQHSSAEPQRGVAFLPKRGVDLHENEVCRAFRTVGDSLIEPVAFIVPRRAEVFQEDIYPPTVGLRPGVTGAEWFAGKTALPPKISLESVYDGQAPQEVASDYAPPAAAKAEEPAKQQPQQSSVPVASEAAQRSSTGSGPAPTPAPAAAAMRGPPPSVKDSQASISDMASKFADDRATPETSSDEASSFEEIPQPVKRPSAGSARPANGGTGAPAGGSTAAAASTSSATTTTAAPKAAPTVTTDTPAEPASSGFGAGGAGGAAAAAAATPTAASPVHRSTSSTGSAAGSAADNLKSHLRDIKELLALQAGKIDSLASDVEYLKGRLSDGEGKDEKIRKLELEIEQLRSE